MDDPNRRDVLKLLTMLLAGGAILPELAEAAQTAAAKHKPSLEPPITTNILQREEISGATFKTWYIATESIGSNNAKLISKGFTTKTDAVTTMHMTTAGHENASDPLPTFTSEYSMTLHAKPLDERHVEMSGHYVLDGKLTAFGPIKAVRNPNLPTDSPTNDELIATMHRGFERRKP